MYGDNAGLISVKRRETNFIESIVWSRTVPSNTTDWSTTVIELEPGLFQVILEGVISDGPLGDVAIDDVSIGDCRTIRKLFYYSTNLLCICYYSIIYNFLFRNFSP